jgi:hypothetical protein
MRDFLKMGALDTTASPVATLVASAGGYRRDMACISSAAASSDETDRI